jgi:hypothetical protein
MNQPNFLKRSIERKKRNHFLNPIGLLTIFNLLFTLPAIAHNHSVILFQPPPENEQPEETEGAASRQLGECTANSSPTQSASDMGPNLTAIVPQSNYGLTTVKRPNFWVYLPQTSAKKAILSIKEKGKTPHWQQSIDLTKKAGITGIKLSENAPALEIGKNYQWAVILVCGDRPSPNDPVVAAWVKPIEQSKTADANLTGLGLEKASAYAQQGIWYDALNILIAEKSSSDNWQDVWVEYLKSGGLNGVAHEPIIGNLPLSNGD